MTIFEKELKNMFDSNDLIKEKAYSGKSLIGRLDEDLRVKMSFVRTGVADVYSALRVKIINRAEGEVDSELFKFADIIEKLSLAPTVKLRKVEMASADFKRADTL